MGFSARERTYLRAGIGDVSVELVCLAGAPSRCCPLWHMRSGLRSTQDPFRDQTAPTGGRPTHPLGNFTGRTLEDRGRELFYNTIPSVRCQKSKTWERFLAEAEQGLA